MSSRYRLQLFTLLLFAVVLGFSSNSGAGALGDLETRALNCGVSSDSIAQVESLVAREGNEKSAVAIMSSLLQACVEQLPVTPLEVKLSEGITKRVPSRLIVIALERQLAGYQFARELLLTTTGTLDQAALKVVGEGVVEGVAKSSFRLFMTSHSQLSPEVILTALTMISLQEQAGFDNALTQRILEKGVVSGNLSHGWQYFVRSILAARKQGLSDVVITDAAIAVLDKGGSVSSVLPALGFTSRDLGGQQDVQ